MYKPLVAVVGRPNVGKSTLFNAIVKKRISIVEDLPGVTRDRIYFDAEWLGREFTLIDTGGIEFVDSDNNIFTSMRYQAELAIHEADVILYVVDGKTGIQPQDQEIAAMLRASGKPVILVVNKIDSVEQEVNIYEFYGLGLGAEHLTFTCRQHTLTDRLVWSSSRAALYLKARPITWWPLQARAAP